MAENTKTIEQQIAAKEAQLTRLRNKQRTLQNGQKVILGGLLINEAMADTKIRTWLLRKAAEKVTREVDIKRLEPLLEDFRKMG